MGASIERRTKIAAMNSWKSNRELIAFITGMGEVNHTCTIRESIVHKQTNQIAHTIVVI